MVEIKSEENNTVQLPNNIRQVGTPGEKIKIYIEDYVMTYLNQMTGEKPALQKAALLLGEKVKKESTDIYFISAAVAVVPMEWKEDRFKLSSDEWTALYDKINHYFKNRHILGWFLSRPGQAAAADGEIEKIHSDNFKDKGPIFYTADPLDREDAFYLYENGHLFRQHGYYIYYDRNEAMQNYMIEIRQENQEMREGTPGFQNRLYEKKTDHHIRREAVSGKSKNRNMKWIPQAAVLVQETCVAEAVHTASSLLGLICLWLWPGWGGAIVLAVWVLLANLPFILIQRYNRPRLMRLAALLRKRAQRKGEQNARTDPDL